MSMRCGGWVVLAFFAVGCAPTPPRIAAADAFRPAERANADEHGRVSRKWARSFSIGSLCERAAREFGVTSEEGWKALQLCLERGDVDNLEELLTYWKDTLRGKPQTPMLLLHVFAARGGDLERDIALAREAGLKLTTITDTLERPSSHRGALVLFIGRAQSHTGPEWMIVEESRRTEMRAAERMSYGSAQGSGWRGVPNNFDTRSYDTGGSYLRVQSLWSETGVRIRARPTRPELVPEGEARIYLARFESARELDDSELEITGTGVAPGPSPLVVIVNSSPVK